VPLWTRRYYLNRARRGIASSQWQRCAHDRRRAAGAWQLPARKIPPQSLKLGRDKIMPHSSPVKRRGKATAKTECNSFVTLVVRIVGRQTDRQNLTGFSATAHAPRARRRCRATEQRDELPPPRSPRRRARAMLPVRRARALGGLEVDDQLNFCDLLHRQALRPCGASSAAKENITISGATPSPFAVQDRAPKAQNVMQITYDAALSPYVPRNEMHSFGRRREAMTWSSDRTGVLLYAILGTLLVMSWIYVPA